MKRRLSLTSIKLSSRNRRCEAAFTGRMYRSSLDARDKGGAIIAVVAIHVLLLFVLLHLSGKIDVVDPQAVLRVFDLQRGDAAASAAAAAVAPGGQAEGSRRAGRRRPTSRARRARRRAARSRADSGPSLRRNSGRGHCSRPRAPPLSRAGDGQPAAPAMVPAAARETAAGRGDGGQLSPPQLVTPVLRGRDFPRDMLDQWPRGTPVFLRLRVDPQGNVSQCIVDRGTGVAAIDSEVCSLVYQRLHFRPALNRSGQAVAGWFGYGQTPPR